MSIKHLSVSELRLNIRDVLEQVKFRNQKVVIVTYGRPMAVMVNIEEWERVSGETVMQIPIFQNGDGSPDVEPQ